MGYDYEALYRDTPDALGEMSAVLLRAFKPLIGRDLRVLDIGCGQGRDALPLARMGFSVFGVDWAPSGIRDMINAAEIEGLDVTGTVADVRSFLPTGHFDVLLIDRTLHMLLPDEQTTVLRRLLGHCANAKWLFISDERANFPRFLTVLEAQDEDWTITRNNRGQLFAERS